jgi:hypothetical protein
VDPDYSYFVVLRGGLDIFACITDASGRSYLDSEPSINCDSKERQDLIPRAIIR